MRGQRDYGMYAPKEVTASISDMGEVAARLGSIVTYDKRGDVVDFDNFESPILKWGKISTAGSTIIHDSTYAASDTQSVKCETLAILNRVAGLWKQHYVIINQQLGVEISLRSFHERGSFILTLRYYRSGILTSAECKLDMETHKLWLLDSTNNFKEIAEVDIDQVIATSFMPIKLVADFSTGYYKRLLFGNTEYDISSELIYSGVTPTGDNLYIQAYFKATTLDQAIGWLDNFVLTQAEP